MTDSTPNLDAIRWDERGLAPAIVQDDLTGQVLMLAYMNRESLKLTLETGETHFWSRSRRELWHKGGTSGNTQKVRSVHYDCDADTLLVLVDPNGPACHTGEVTCFHHRLDSDQDVFGAPFRYRLYRRLRDRKLHPQPGSYTSKLLLSGEPRVLQKLGEEAIETIVAAQSEGNARLTSEAADLMYHLIVLLVLHDMTCEDVDRELRQRYGTR
jgi:phosphoribosyl-ATP pyrophosphohydrolase/phosphoribosyl-AMP cyclohydrolase